MIYYIHENQRPFWDNYSNKSGSGILIYYNNLNNNPKKEKLDKYAENNDIDSMKFVDSIGLKAVKAYNDVWKDYGKLQEILWSLKDYSFKYFHILDPKPKKYFHIFNIKRPIGFQLTIYSSKYKYKVIGNVNGKITDRYFSEMTDKEKNDLTGNTSMTGKEFRSFLYSSIDKCLDELNISEYDRKFSETQWMDWDYISINQRVFYVRDAYYDSENDKIINHNGQFDWINDFCKMLEFILQSKCDNVNSVYYKKYTDKNNPTESGIDIFIKLNAKFAN